MSGQTAANMAARRAAVLFKHFGWKWSRAGGDIIPSAAEIEEEYERLLDYVHECGSTRVETGRLIVEKADRDNGHGDRFLLDLAESNPYNGEAMG